MKFPKSAAASRRLLLGMIPADRWLSFTEVVKVVAKECPEEMGHKRASIFVRERLWEAVIELLRSEEVVRKGPSHGAILMLTPAGVRAREAEFLVQPVTDDYGRDLGVPRGASE